MKTVSIKLCNPERHPSQHVYRLTFDGTIMGDSRGYSKDKAIVEARQRVANNSDRYVLAPELEA